ncbi:MAG: hypothetical protein NC390_03945 [Fusobacterium sp.]|nr:hypothetical protein [Fusobacterium sp.]
MAVRILIFLLAFVVITNLIISLVGLIFGVNMYKKFGKQILIGYAGFGLVVMFTFIVMAILGLA